MKAIIAIAAAFLLLGGVGYADDTGAATTMGFVRSAAIPQTVAELWAGFAEFDKATPLETEILKTWEQDGVVCRLVRYQVGVFKGVPAKVAAFYAFPKGATKLPALLSMHGGGQSAGIDSVVTDAKRGYASISLNWGGNKLNFGRSKETYDGPQTDWGKLDATHPPQRNKANHFAGALRDLCVGGDATGTLNVSGTGQLNIGHAMSLGQFEGQGTVNQTGGSVSGGSTDIGDEYSSARFGTYNFSGGSHNTSYLTIENGLYYLSGTGQLTTSNVKLNSWGTGAYRYGQRGFAVVSS